MVLYAWVVCYTCVFVCCLSFLYFIKLNIYFSILYLFVRILWVRVRVQVEVRREQPLRESISCDIQFAIRQNQSYIVSICFTFLHCVFSSSNWYIQFSNCDIQFAKQISLHACSLWHIWFPQFFIDLWQLH